MPTPDFIPSERRAYAFRMAGSLIASLLLTIGCVRWWPADGPEDAGNLFDARPQEMVQIEEIAPTLQESRKPPPPAPRIPVVIPDDVILDAEEIELLDVLELVDAGKDPDATGPPPPPGEAGPARPDAGPRVVRFVQPEYTREAQRRKIRAEVVVVVRVDESGRVQDTRIVDRYLLGKDAESREAVASLGYGLEEAALAAARQCMFRPARIDGRRAASDTRLTFTFGV